MDSNATAGAETLRVAAAVVARVAGAKRFAR